MKHMNNDFSVIKISESVYFISPGNYDLILKFAQNPLKFTIHGIFMCWS